MEPGASSTQTTYVRITVQYQSFEQVEETIAEALDNLRIYYNMNSLPANQLERPTLCLVCFQLPNA